MFYKLKQLCVLLCLSGQPKYAKVISFKRSYVEIGLSCRRRTINWPRLPGELLDEPNIFYKALVQEGEYKITNKLRILILNIMSNKKVPSLPTHGHTSSTIK